MKKVLFLLMVLFGAAFVPSVYCTESRTGVECSQSDNNDKWEFKGTIVIYDGDDLRDQGSLWWKKVELYRQVESSKEVQEVYGIGRKKVTQYKYAIKFAGIDRYYEVKRVDVSFLCSESRRGRVTFNSSIQKDGKKWYFNNDLPTETSTSLPLSPLPLPNYYDGEIKGADI